MSESQLKDALKEMLENSGDYNRLTAEMRALVYNLLVKTSPSAGTSASNSQPEHLDLLDSIVHEYLLWKSCHYTSQVFQSECGLEEHRLASRQQMMATLGFVDSQQTSNLPLLAGIIEHFKKEAKNINEKIKIN